MSIWNLQRPHEMGSLDVHPGPRRNWIGDYEVLDRLGVGGMGDVYLARKGGEVVAIKRVLPRLACDPEYVRLFFDEAQVSSTLRHPNIVRILGMGDHDGAPFLVMEHVHGLNLRELQWQMARTRDRLEIPAVARVVAAVCAALEHAHSCRDADGRSLGIVHRDVCPSNTLVSVDGEVKLIDFGIARAAGRVYTTRVGEVKGKCAYMSPEQARGEAVDHRTDIYAAGLLLYELVTGVSPLQARTEQETLERARLALPPFRIASQLPAELAQIAMRALARCPDDRYSYAGEMARALEPFHGGSALVRSALGNRVRRLCVPAQKLGRDPRDGGSATVRVSQLRREPWTGRPGPRRDLRC